ncbi:MAG TPA: hypothetical protein VG826_06705 [Pirellulales bacterium]|nr:hypothetical protein [Pirellulales bacterium]
MGLYSAGHSILQHNHVLKPILSDDVEESAEGEPSPARDLRFMSDKISSRSGLLPMERRAENGASETSPDETTGEKLCHP